MSGQNNSVMYSAGEILRQNRESRGLLLRQVAAAIEIDPTLLSKIERGERLPTKDQINSLSEYYKDENHLIMIAWLSDKVLDELSDDINYAEDVLNMTMKKIKKMK